MKIPKELKNKAKKVFEEYDKLDNMRPNRQIGRAMQETVHYGNKSIQDKIDNHPKIIKLLEKHDRIIASKPVWYENDYIKFQEKYYKKAKKIIDSILTDEDNITILEEALKYTAAEIKQLELYEDSEDYWTDRL